MATKNRSDLKSYFVKNAIPTEGNFADLIDSQLNQTQDGVFKPEGEALSVVAVPGDQKRVLRLYASYPAASPDWMISLNPAQDPANAVATGKTGLGITDGAGKPRLFIDAATGQIGIGTNAPQVALDVAGAVQANGFRGRYDLVLNDYRTVNPTSNVCLQSPPTDRDAWIYRDSVATTSNLGIYHRQIDTAVAGLPANSIGFVGGVSSTLQAYISLADGSGYFAGKLGIGTTAPEASLHVTNGSRFTGGQHHFKDAEGAGRLRVGAAWAIPGLYSEDNQDIIIGCAAGKTVQLGGPSNRVTAVDGALRAPGGLSFDGAVGHIDKDGALYRNSDGQVYLTVDDHLYIRRSGTGNSWAAHFDTNSGHLELRGFIIQYSDLRLKENIEPVVGSLARLRQLQGVSFDWKDRQPGTRSKHLGFVAQDVQAVVPEAVVETSDDMLAIAYHAITALVVEAIKEQQQQIDELRAASSPSAAPVKTEP